MEATLGTQNIQGQEGCGIQTYILYASETGTCEDLSQDLAVNLRNNHSTDYPELKQVKVATLNQAIETENLLEKDKLKIVVVIASSTGDGESPENGQKFRKYLETQTGDKFGHVFYTMLGLGDSTYAKFLGNPNLLENKLNSLGASFFYKRGIADESQGAHLAINLWLKELPNALKQIIDRLRAMSNAEIQGYLQNTSSQSDSMNQLDQDLPETSQNFVGKLKSREVICDQDDKKVIQIQIELDSPVSRSLLDVGQSISIYPQNNVEKVNQIFETIGIDWPRDLLLDGKTSLESKIRESVDICSRKVNLELLVEKIMWLTGDFDQDLEQLMADKHKYTLLELGSKCEVFAQERALLTEECIDLLPRIKPRYYSLANDPFQSQDCPLESGTLLEICFTLHKFENPVTLELQSGLCTSYLSEAPIGTKLMCSVSKNSRVLTLPPSIQTKPINLVIICMGTGVVPFISMLMRIVMLQPENLKIQMFYAVRSDSKNLCYYSDFLKAFFSSRVNSFKLTLACSREITGAFQGLENISVCKGYLQEVLKSFNIKEFLGDSSEESLHVQICGNKNALSKIVNENLQLDEAKITQMKQEGRLLQELWNE